MIAELVDGLAEGVQAVVHLLSTGQLGVILFNDGINALEYRLLIEPAHLAVHAYIQVVDDLNAMHILPYAAKHGGGGTGAQTAEGIDRADGVLHFAAQLGVALVFKIGFV